MRINSLKIAAIATIAAATVSIFGTAAFAVQSSHSVTSTVVRADATPTPTAQSANDPWD